MNVLIAMSGGVDSSVVAFLMKKSGAECSGVTMKLTDSMFASPSCCTDDDINDAKNVAKALGIPHKVVNFTSNFKEMVVDSFVRCYENGLTPNPCILCNRYIKFNQLFSELDKSSDSKIATGHYARVDYDKESGRYLLKKACDPSKDQTYVLYSLTQEQLSKVIFPLGEFTKSAVREIAEANGFINANKKDSQDICFIKDGKYYEFIESYTKKAYPGGDFIDKDGNVLGSHKGIIRYTVGQGKKLGLILPEPLYVSSVNAETNKVTLVKESELYEDTLYAGDLNLISVKSIEKPMRVKAKIRYRHTEASATAVQTDTDTLKVVFDEPQRAITKGQAVVLYDGDIVVCGATII